MLRCGQGVTVVYHPGVRFAPSCRGRPCHPVLCGGRLPPTPPAKGLAPLSKPRKEAALPARVAVRSCVFTSCMAGAQPSLALPAGCPILPTHKREGSSPHSIAPQRQLPGSMIARPGSTAEALLFGLEGRSPPAGERERAGGGPLAENGLAEPPLPDHGASGAAAPCSLRSRAARPPSRRWPRSPARRNQSRAS